MVILSSPYCVFLPECTDDEFDKPKYENLEECPSTTYRRERFCKALVKEDLVHPACCECVGNTVFDGKRCVPEDQCFCIDKDGVRREAGDEWTDPEEPCEIYECENGEISDRFVVTRGLMVRGGVHQ